MGCLRECKTVAAEVKLNFLLKEIGKNFFWSSTKEYDMVILICDFLYIKAKNVSWSSDFTCASRFTSHLIQTICQSSIMCENSQLS